MKRILSLLICLALMSVPALAAEGAGLDRFRAETQAAPYSDVQSGAWYYGTVMAATSAGLLSGRGDGSFDPDGDIKLSEAAKIAAVIHDIYNGGDGVFAEDGDTWYQYYVDYAAGAGIVSYADYAGFDVPATRAQVAGILARALPDSELRPINTISSLPDASETDKYGAEIFRLYRAGVLVGNDEYGTFRPDDAITRAETATLAARLVLLTPRESFTPKEPPPLDALEKQLTEILAGYHGIWSVYVRDLESGANFTINDTPMLAASLVKLFAAGAACEAAENGAFELTATVDGYLSSMLSYSNETATDNIFRLLGGGVKAYGQTAMTDWAARNGYSSSGYLFLERERFTTRVTSARDCGEFLSAVYGGTLVSAASSERILGHLKNQRSVHKIPAALPDGTVTANKTGELSADYYVESDAAIVYAPFGDYVLAVLSNDATPSVARANIKSISALVYDYLQTN